MQDGSVDEAMGVAVPVFVVVHIPVGMLVVVCAGIVVTNVERVDVGVAVNERPVTMLVRVRVRGVRREGVAMRRHGSTVSPARVEAGGAWGQPMSCWRMPTAAHVSTVGITPTR